MQKSPIHSFVHSFPQSLIQQALILSIVLVLMTWTLTMSSAKIVTVLLMLAHGYVSQANFMSSDPRSSCHSICWKGTSSGDNGDGAKKCLGSCIRFISDALAFYSGGIDASDPPASSASENDVADTDGDAPGSPLGRPERLGNLPDTSLILDQLIKRGRFVRIGKSGEFSGGPHRRSLPIPGVRPGMPFFGQGLQRGARLNADDNFEQRKFSHFVRIGRAKGAFVRIGKGKGDQTEDAEFLRLACTEGRQDVSDDNNGSSSGCHGNNEIIRQTRAD